MTFPLVSYLEDVALSIELSTQAGEVAKSFLHSVNVLWPKTIWSLRDTIKMFGVDLEPHSSI